MENKEQPKYTPMEKGKKKKKKNDGTGRNPGRGMTRGKILLELAKIYPQGLDTYTIAIKRCRFKNSTGFQNNHLRPLEEEKIIIGKGAKFRRKGIIRLIRQHPKWHIIYNIKNFTEIVKIMKKRDALPELIKTPYFIENFENIFGCLIKKIHNQLPEKEKGASEKSIISTIKNVIRISPTGFKLFFNLLDKNIKEIVEIFNPTQKRICLNDIGDFFGEYCLLADQIEGYNSPEIKRWRFLSINRRKMLREGFNNYYMQLGAKVQKDFEEEERKYYGEHTELFYNDYGEEAKREFMKESAEDIKNLTKKPKEVVKKRKK